MWIFGYGSLMFDGWEAACGCVDRKCAELPGYRRAFNKKSVEILGHPGGARTDAEPRAGRTIFAGVLRLPSRITTEQIKYSWTLKREKPASRARLPLSLRTARKSQRRSSSTKGEI